jgi:cation:H+ antiporter
MVGLLATLWLSQSSGGRVAWVPKDRNAPNADVFASGTRTEEENEDCGSVGVVLWKTAAAALVILVAGYVLTRTGESIAARTGLGDSFFGALFLAIATSLPELSSVTAAIRAKRPELAFGDVFGGNLFDVGLIFVVDAVYRGAPVLDEVAASAGFLALVVIAVTSVLIGGLIQRRDRVFLRLGYDSIAIVALYVAGLTIVYHMQ